MKQVSVFLISFLTAISIYAQQNISVVNITVNGNKDLQISIDGSNFNQNNSMIAGNKTTFALNTLERGQHSLLIIRTNPNGKRQDKISTVFMLRRGYDMLINVNANGSLELIEKKTSQYANNRVAINNPDYNNLLNTVRNQRSASGKRNIIANAFNTTNNYFSTAQVVSLLQLVNSESFRLELAKLSYRIIGDRNNFNQVYELLNAQASRNALEDYVNNFYEDNYPEDYNNAMTDADFNNLYQTIKQQWPVSTQMNSLTNAFNNSYNYFTTYQASQLIQLITAENNRLQLAKLSYRSIMDPANFNQIINLFSNQANRNELIAYVNNYNSNNGYNTNVAMSDANFNSLYQTIQQQWPVSIQMNSLTNAFNNTNNYFTTNQASKLIQLVSTENNRLQLAKLSYRSIIDPANFNQIINLFSNQANRNELITYVNNYNYNNGYNTKVAMSDANFNSLYQTVQQQWPVSIQMNSLTNAFNNTNNYFTTNQVSQLIQLVSAENNRLQLAKLSYRSIIDPANFSQIYNLFSSQASRNELMNYINNYSTGNNPNVAMSDVDFTNLYQTIQWQLFPGQKMSSITDAFNKTGNYFTSAQAKQLIQLVSSETNRLQLAKLSYRIITDRSNFSQLYDLLENQSSKNELDAYVKAYRD